MCRRYGTGIKASSQDQGHFGLLVRERSFFDGKTIKQEKDWVKEKNRAKGMEAEAGNLKSRSEVRGLLVFGGWWACLYFL
jgi:hypothetical protein